VSVKKLTGTTTLAVDGKTDASNRGDMLTQKLIAHCRCAAQGSEERLHARSRQRHDRGRGADASDRARRRDRDLAGGREGVGVLQDRKRNALADPRTHLIVGDGRSHLALSNQKYDVIVSEPSNPWIAGVSSLFTKEFFESARERLAPGGIICQWANAYNISEQDLKSIVATFTSVFPNGRCGW
jgi:spermidine synthase